MHRRDGRLLRDPRTGPGREQFRLVCLLEDADTRTLAARGLQGPAIAVIVWMHKRSGTVFSERDYAKVRGPRGHGVCG